MSQPAPLPQLKLAPLPYQVRAELYTQLAQMEINGLPFERALAMVKLQTVAQPRVAIMSGHIARGADPAQAGEKSGVFTRLEARLIRAALSAGSPGNMYKRLATFYSARAQQLATVKSQLALPAAVLVTALLVQPLPALVAGRLSLLGFVWGVAKPLLIIGGVIALLRWWLGGESSGNSIVWQQRVPLYGPIYVRRNLRDFFESLALMLEAGLPILDALPAALDTVEDRSIRRDLARIRPAIEKGANFTDALRECKTEACARAAEFANTGEASGALPEMLMRHCQFETDAINRFYKELAAWVPRIVYAMVALWMAYGLLTGGGTMTAVPKDL